MQNKLLAMEFLLCCHHGIIPWELLFAHEWMRSRQWARFATRWQSSLESRAPHCLVGVSPGYSRSTGAQLHQHAGPGPAREEGFVVRGLGDASMQNRLAGSGCRAFLSAKGLTSVSRFPAASGGCSNSTWHMADGTVAGSGKSHGSGPAHPIRNTAIAQEGVSGRPQRETFDETTVRDTPCLGAECGRTTG